MVFRSEESPQVNQSIYSLKTENKKVHQKNPIIYFYEQRWVLTNRKADDLVVIWGL